MTYDGYSSRNRIYRLITICYVECYIEIVVGVDELIGSQSHVGGTGICSSCLVCSAKGEVIVNIVQRAFSAGSIAAHTMLCAVIVNGAVFTYDGNGYINFVDGKASRRHRRRLIIAAHVNVVGVHNRVFRSKIAVGVGACVGAAGWRVGHCQHVTCGKAGHGVIVVGNLRACARHGGDGVAFLRSAVVVEGAVFYCNGQRGRCNGQRAQFLVNSVVVRKSAPPSNVVAIVNAAHNGQATRSCH